MPFWKGSSKKDTSEFSASTGENPWGMKMFVDKPGDLAGQSDIIAIHGLNGHFANTWTATTRSGKQVNWLKDFLPSHVPDARIMSYGYNSTVQYSKSLSGIDDFADQLLEDIMSWRTFSTEKSRPIVFICHSLSGLVFKQALNRAHERSRYAALLSHVGGVIFFATPHRGSDLADWAATFTKILKVSSLGTSTNARLTKELQTHSEILSKISKSFVARSENLVMFSFHETEMMPNMNCKIVDDSSAILLCPNETSLPMNGNHRSICRFGSPDEQGFRNVWTNLQSIINPKSDQLLSEEESSCRQMFYTSDYESDKKRNDLSVKGTCQWFPKHEDYQAWYQAKCARLLWVSADAGCGKSVLTSFLIDREFQMEQTQLSTNKRPRNVCYFFFKDDNGNQTSAASAVSAILHQIYTFQPCLLSHAVDEQSKKGITAYKDFHSLWGIFVETVSDKRANDTICFIDGLDECDPKSRKSFIDALAQIFSKTPDASQRSNLKLLIISRPQNEIKVPFQKIGFIRLKGEDEIEHISHDVELVVKAHIDDLEDSGLPADILEPLCQELIRRADRTFLWTTLIIHLLKDAAIDGASESDLLAILESRDIDDVYGRLLSNRKSPNEARRMLHIVIAAGRPLSLAEISVAMCIIPKQDLDTR